MPGKNKTVGKGKSEGNSKSNSKGKIKVVRPKLNKSPARKNAAKVKSVQAKSGVDLHMDRVEAEIKGHKQALTSRKMVAPVSVVSASEVKKDLTFFERSFEQAGDVYSLSFYFVSAMVCVALLAFLFGTAKTFIFYSIFGLFLWWWIHRFHVSRLHILKPFLSLGSLTIFLYFFYLAFNDLLSLLVCVMYSISFVIAGALYLYHTKNEFTGEIHRSFPRTFLVMFYAHIIALTAASILAYALPPLLLGDSFVSIMFLLVAWLFPVLLAYFFFTKFLYLRFFDRVHIKRDALKGLAHGAGYAGVFVALMLLAYLLSAIQLTGMERVTYASIFETGTMSLAESKLEIYSAFGEEFPGFGVAKDMMGIIDTTMADILAKEDLLQRSFSFNDYISDDYFTMLAGNRRLARSAAGSAFSVADVGADVVREYGRMKMYIAQGVFEEGTQNLEDHDAFLKAYLSAYYAPYSEPPQFSALRQRLAGSKEPGMDLYSALFADGQMLDFNLAYDPDMRVFVSGDSRFSKRFHWMMYHTIVFRDMMLFVLDSLLLEVDEVVEPYPVRLLQASADDYLPSNVLRNRVIKANFDATVSLIDS
ncbi:MAG: hypothetical protein V1729_03645 [Candidatus Woesearchaeota archaeon]